MPRSVPQAPAGGIAAIKFRSGLPKLPPSGPPGNRTRPAQTMRLAALSSVKHRIHVGVPLPFNVRDADRTLLLARGHVIASAGQLEALFLRGAVVDLAELRSPNEEAMQAPRRELPRLWNETLTRITNVLEHCDSETFRGALEEASAPALALVERDPDLAIFQILSQAAGVDTAYGVRRSLHSAITASLVAQRLAWQAAEVERAFKAALTMNLSMLELQGVLARQATPPSADQRAELRSHPMRSVQMLQRAGVSDADWLRAVLQHHELEDGSGYPSGRRDVSELASLLRRADIYTSKLSARSTREAMAADVAGRAMFMADPGHPMTHAIVKEFGIYPPGSHVRLASGALAVVVGRGPSITAPVVACLTDAAGKSLPAPRRTATTDPAQAVVALLPAKRGDLHVGAETLVSLD
jgi:HD-GYP domain-containing protein (c-di-GMP phosphodiesterase class II)